MWFVGVAFVSIVSSLFFGRLLARSAAQETYDPRRVRGPAIQSDIEANRLVIAQQAAFYKSLETTVHLN